MKKVLEVIFSGIAGVMLTLMYQHFFTQPQSFTFYIDEQKVTVTEETYTEISQENEVLQQKLNDLNKEYSGLERQNKELYDNYNTLVVESNQEIEELNNQLKDMPVIDYKNLSLCIDGDDIPINSDKSAVTINGRDYFSKEIMEKVIPENKIINIENNRIFISNVVAEENNLFDKYVLEYNHAYSYLPEVEDTYGNLYKNAMVFSWNNSYITYNLNREYSYFKCKIASQKDSYFHGNNTITVTVLADDVVVYTSEKIEKLTEPFETDAIPIYNCLRLKICVEGDSGYIIMSDAVVYN